MKKGMYLIECEGITFQVQVDKNGSICELTPREYEDVPFFNIYKGRPAELACGQIEEYADYLFMIKDID